MDRLQVYYTKMSEEQGTNKEVPPMTWGLIQHIFPCMNTNIDEVRRQAPTWNPSMSLVQWDRVNHRYVEKDKSFLQHYIEQLPETISRGSRPRVPNGDYLCFATFVLTIPFMVPKAKFFFRYSEFWKHWFPSCLKLK